MGGAPRTVRLMMIRGGFRYQCLLSMIYDIMYSAAHGKSGAYNQV